MNQIVIPLPAIGPEKIYVGAIRVEMHGFMVQQDIETKASAMRVWQHSTDVSVK